MSSKIEALYLLTIFGDYSGFKTNKEKTGECYLDHGEIAQIYPKLLPRPTNL